MSRPVPPLRERKRVLRIVGLVACALMVLAVLTIFGFIVRTELAHDEAECPFEDRELRRVGQGVAVQEQARRCLPEVEEHRWMILRAGEAPREFARRRLHTRFFARGSYRFKLRTDQDGQLVLDVQNDGTRPIEVREAKLLDQ